MSTQEQVHSIHPVLADLASPVLNLTTLPGNPRKGDVDAVARSLRVFGQRKPITARLTGTDEHGDPTGYVTAGNHTLLAARDRLEWTHVAVVWVDEDETKANAWALADNRSAELGTNDDDALRAMIGDIAEVDPDLLEAASYTDEDLAKLFAPDDPNLLPPGDQPAVDIGPQWGVIVTCNDEDTQVELLTRLSTEGFTVRAMM